MKRSSNKKAPGARSQTAIEYLLLLGVVTAIVLGGFNFYIKRSQEQANVFFNEAARGIMGAPISSGAANPARTNYP